MRCRGRHKSPLWTVTELDASANPVLLQGIGRMYMYMYILCTHCPKCAACQLPALGQGWTNYMYMCRSLLHHFATGRGTSLGSPTEDLVPTRKPLVCFVHVFHFLKYPHMYSIHMCTSCSYSQRWGRETLGTSCPNPFNFLCSQRSYACARGESLGGY